MTTLVFLSFTRTDVFQIVDHFIYDDGSEELGDDTFSREPFVIRLKSSKSPGKEICCKTRIYALNTRRRARYASAAFNRFLG